MGHLGDFEWFVGGEKRLAEPTVKAYFSDLVSWQQAGLNLEQEQPLSVELLSDCLKQLQNEGLKSATQQRRRVALRAFIRFRSFTNIAWLDLLEHLPVKTQKDIFPVSITKDEARSFLELPVVEGVPESYRDRVIFEFCYASGLRVSELCQLRWADLDERSLAVHLTGKGDKQRIVPYTERVEFHLKQYKEHAWGQWALKAKSSNQEFIFLSRRCSPLTRMAVWKIFRRRSMVLNLSIDVHPHVLRHSFATHLLQGGADVRFVQALLGHSSVNTTERYLKIDSTELQKLFEEFHPLG
ncbi:tyrosine-type recombinase/integrase [bacterium]|nr:tyrosine-type recombinase/integrase [bacterium]